MLKGPKASSQGFLEKCPDPIYPNSLMSKRSAKNGDRDPKESISNCTQDGTPKAGVQEWFDIIKSQTTSRLVTVKATAHGKKSRR